VANFTTVTCRISSQLKRYKNYKNRLRLIEVIVEYRVTHFYGQLLDVVRTVYYYYYYYYYYYAAFSAPCVGHKTDESQARGHVYMISSARLQLAELTI